MTRPIYCHSDSASTAADAAHAFAARYWAAPRRVVNARDELGSYRFQVSNGLRTYEIRSYLCAWGVFAVEEATP